MRYEQVKKGIFLARPNRFIAHVLVDDTETVCHVKNTGRCRELLVPGAAVYLEKGTNPNRKTAYDLIAVEKNGKLINMDAQAPNKVFAEWALQFDPTATAVHSEYRFGQSRRPYPLSGRAYGAGREAPPRADARGGAGASGHGVFRDPNGGRGGFCAQ